MTIEAGAVTPAAANPAAPGTHLKSRSFAWSLRRELWEYRSIWIAPLSAAGFVLFGFLLSLTRMPHTLQKMSKLPVQAQSALRLIPFGIAAAAILITTLVVAAFYCLGALYNERRDRSILFWKSMPVSDATTVLSKATVPLVILPLVGVLAICATQLAMLLMGTAAYAAQRLDPAALWSSLPLLRAWLLLLYGIATLALWYAPIYAWLFVLSAWARRGPFLWAVLPPLAVSLVEKLAFDTSWFSRQMAYRLGGSVHEAFVGFPSHKPGLTTSFQWPQPDPVRFFSSPGLWVGLFVAAALFLLAVWLRRRREPM